MSSDNLGQSTTLMRKSLDSLVNTSQNVIGSSISQALAFTSTMTLPVSNETTNKSSERISSDDKSTTCVDSSMLEPDQIADQSGDSPNHSLTKRKTPKPGENGVERVESKSEKGEKKKRKSSWLNVLYPTYKSRSEDFKKLFKDVPDDERLVVDYSCALQKEILVHGRLYVTQNFLCFYANIFGWETLVCLQWKDVTAITKEKIALVIPNAILVCTQSEKMFFTSFGTRDKAYLMLFRVWQNALMGKQMAQQEMWQWVHFCYGDELGLTSDDEDYIPPNNEDDKLTVGQRLSVESIIEKKNSETVINLPTNENNKRVFSRIEENSRSHYTVDFPEFFRIDFLPFGLGRFVTEVPKTSPNAKLEPIKMITTLSKTPEDIIKTSDTESKTKARRIVEENRNKILVQTSSDSEGDKQRGSRKKRSTIPSFVLPTLVQCEVKHEGRELVNTTVPVVVDKLFNLLFTNSKFMLDLQEQRRTTNFIGSSWTKNQVSGQQFRTVSYTVSLNATVGPKTCDVTEAQILMPPSKPGELYSICIESTNANVPYADSFYVCTHYCLSSSSELETKMEVFAEIKYRKSLWGLVKGMIEKNCWAGMEEYFQRLLTAIKKYAETNPESPVPVKRKAPRPPRRKTPISLPPEALLSDSSLRTLSELSELPEIVNNNNIVSGGVILEPSKSNQSSTVIAVNNIIPRNNNSTWFIFAFLILLLILNVVLYMRLWTLEAGYSQSSNFDINLLSDIPKEHNEWMEVLQQQERIHASEVEKWDHTLKYTIELLRKAEESLSKLQSQLKSTIISDISEAITSIQEKLSTETLYQKDVSNG